MTEGSSSRTRWRIVGGVAALALGVSMFGGLVLPRLRADVPARPLEQPALKLLLAERECEHPDRKPEL